MSGCEANELMPGSWLVGWLVGLLGWLRLRGVRDVISRPELGYRYIGGQGRRSRWERTGQGSRTDDRVRDWEYFE